MNRIVLAAVLIFFFAPSFGPTPLAASQSGVTVIYISAWNCPPCFVWDRDDKPKWVASPEYKLVNFRIVEVPAYQHITYKPNWPEDLEWVRATLKRSGAPRYLILKDKKVLLNTHGLRGWREKAMPLIRKLTAGGN